MAIYRGNNEITKIYRGNTEIQNVYRGTNLIYSNNVDTDSLIITIKTDNVGTSNDNQYTLDVFGNYDVDWGDGNVNLGVTNSQTHTYSSIGTYDVKVSNTFTNYIFNSSGDGRKIIDVKQFGSATLTLFNNSFNSCTSLSTLNATDAPDLSITTTMQNGFISDFSFNTNINNWDVSNVTNFRALFFGCLSFNQPLNNWNMSSANDLNSMFRNTSFNQDISAWDITNVSDFGNFMNGNNSFSTVNYDLLLVGWEATLQGTYPAGAGYPYTITAHFGTAKFTLGSSAETARTSLINNFGWTITDGGGI